MDPIDPETAPACDLLVIGAGGAGLFAALRAHQLDPALDITLLAKGIAGKSGCTRMVQGGYNAAFGADDSPGRHFMDTIEGGKWINDQELAWILVHEAIERILELENRYGCFFDRNPDGTLHQKPFAGQTADRTIHKGDLTGIEIINRLFEQVLARPIRIQHECRALGLVRSADGSRLAGALVLEIPSGRIVYLPARAVILASGGGPSMYRYHTPSGDKSCDGLAMALRLGLELRDMEMVQFHPTGLVTGPEARITGTIIEEGLRGAGGHLLDGAGHRFMLDVSDRAERATRDVVSRAIFECMQTGTTGPRGGVFLSMQHLDPAMVRSRFPGMVRRCRDLGMDLVAGQIEVVPTAHYLMGGIRFGPDGTTQLPGLFAAGEDTGGVHGANRLGGNGVANSTVFGALAGESAVRWLAHEPGHPAPDAEACRQEMVRALRPFRQPEAAPERIAGLRSRLSSLMWEDVGIIRNEAALLRAQTDLAALHEALLETGIRDGERRFHPGWQQWLDLESLITVSQAITAAGVERRNSRGAHFRSDWPEPGDLATSTYTRVRLDGATIQAGVSPVQFTRVRPGETLLHTQS